MKKAIMCLPGLAVALAAAAPLLMAGGSAANAATAAHQTRVAAPVSNLPPGWWEWGIYSSRSDCYEAAYYGLETSAWDNFKCTFIGTDWVDIWELDVHTT